jgi:hypothetical protein
MKLRKMLRMESVMNNEGRKNIGRKTKIRWYDDAKERTQLLKAKNEMHKNQLATGN